MMIDVSRDGHKLMLLLEPDRLGELLVASPDREYMYAAVDARMSLTAAEARKLAAELIVAANRMDESDPGEVAGS